MIELLPDPPSIKKYRIVLGDLWDKVDEVEPKDKKKPKKETTSAILEDLSSIAIHLLELGHPILSLMLFVQAGSFWTCRKTQSSEKPGSLTTIDPAQGMRDGI